MPGTIAMEWIIGQNMAVNFVMNCSRRIMQTTKLQFAYEIQQEYRDTAKILLNYDSTKLDYRGLEALINVTNRISMLMEIWEDITRSLQ